MYAVNKFAAAFFNGGGHKKMLCRKENSELGLKETVQLFESLIWGEHSGRNYITQKPGFSVDLNPFP